MLISQSVCPCISANARALIVKLNQFSIRMLRNSNYVYGAKDLQVPANLHLGEYMLDKMWGVREKTLFIDGSTGESITYGQVVQQTMNFAVSLTHLGARKGDVVAICTENRFEFWPTLIGGASAGAVLTTVNPGYTEGEIKHVMGISKPKFVVMSPNTFKLHGKTFKSLPYIKTIIIFGENRPSNVLLYNDLAVSNNHGNGSVIVNNYLARNVKYKEFEVVDVNGQTDTVFILYSSGTTGLPKGVMLTHLNVLASCCLPKVLSSEDIGLTITPWFHTMGLNGLLSSIAAGRTSVHLPKFDVDLYLKTIEKYKIIQLSVVPPVVVAVCKAPDKYDLSSVKTIYSGGAPLHKEMIEMTRKRFPKVEAVLQGYGMTETTLAVLRDTYDQGAVSKPGSVGKAVAGVTLKIVDIESRVPLGPNQPGEICAKGQIVMKGYVGKDKSADFDEEGFFKTGDVGYYDEDGCFFIVDRLKELIKYKAFQVAPAEIEALLLDHPCIRDAGVVGIPDKAAGEVPMAFVVKQAGKSVTEKDIQQFVAERLSNPKHLRGGVRFVDGIPKNPSGKILRRALKKMASTSKSRL